jgi:pimeloyl-ACP methyl ester carboxylesterase
VSARVGLDLEVDGRRLEAIELPGGDPDRCPLVLLHEGLGSVSAWRDFPEALQRATSRRVLAFSRFGHGRSDPPAEPRTPAFFHEEALDILPHVLRRLDAREPVLVGHSDGASIAAIYAGSHQDHRVRGLVLIAPHFICEDITHASIAELRKEFEAGELRSRLARWHADVDATVRGWSDVWLGPDFRAWDISEYLAYIRVPVLIVQGEDDHYGTVRQIAIVQEECYCPVEVALLPGARHSPQREAPEATMRVVTEFIARLLQIDCLGQQSAAR